VIWGSTAALALLSGTGIAFVLWRTLHRSPDTGLAAGAVVAIALGLALIGFAFNNARARFFLTVAAAAMAIAFFAGAGVFATITG